MAKNLGRKYATMSEDERRRFALVEEEGSRELPAELSFDEPRDEDKTSAQVSGIREEVADPEHRDGSAALLDDEQHERAVQEAARKGRTKEPDSR